MNYIEPGCVLLSRPTFTGRIELYNSVKNNVKAELSAASYACLTIDIWTSLAVDAYLGVTAHYLSCREPKSCALSVKPSEERYNGANIAEWIEGV